MRIVDISTRRPVMVIVAVIALLLVGFLSYKSLTLNDMPEADIPIVSVTVTNHGVSPDQMESKIGKKVEEAIGQISGVKHISTIISEGVCNVVVEFSLDIDADVAAQEVKDKISAIRQSLPSEMDEPIVSKFDIAGSPILSLAVTSDMDSKVLSKLIDDVLTKQLYAVNGVGSVKVYGEEEREVQIKIDMEKMASYGLTPTEMVAGVMNGNLEKPGGTVNDSNKEISLRTDNNVKNIDDFYNISVGNRSGYDVKIKDVADVLDGAKKKDTLSFYDGKPAISIDIIKQSGANTVKVADELKQKLAYMNQVMPSGIDIKIIRDNSESIRESVDEVVKTIVEGCVLAVIIVFIFLGEWQTTLISAVSLPVSIITTFICLKGMDFSLNTMSLMALSLAVGLLIDDAIVVIENIVRHLHMGKGPLEAAREATSEIGLAVIATTLAVVAVFIPVALVSGIIGKFFIEFGLTVAFSMLVSLMVSFTLVPMMSSKMLSSDEKAHDKKHLIGHLFGGFNRWFDGLADGYTKLLKIALRHRFITLFLTLALFVGSIMLVPQLGFSFIPSTDNGELTVDAGLNPGLTLEAKGEKALALEKIIRKEPTVVHLYTTVNDSGASIFVKLVDKKERKDSSVAIAERIRGELLKVPGVELSITSGSLGPSTGKNMSLIIQGEDITELRKVAQSAKHIMEQDPASRDVAINDKVGGLETKLVVDRDKATDLGINVSLAADTLNALYDGLDAGKFDWGGERYNIRISAKDDQKKNLDSIDKIFIQTANGDQVSLGSVTSKVLTTSEATIHRYDRLKQIEISANVYGMPVGDYLNKYTAILKKEAAKEKGVQIRSGGSDESMQEGFLNLVIALFMGILFMYMIMAVQFESFLEPIAIMFALPMAIIGAIFGLFVAGSEMSIMSLIGIILLMGLVAKNGILLVDFTKHGIANGKSVKEALIEAGKVRMRPIIMTSLAMIFGMIPVATATGAGTEMRAPMGHAVIGGLISSTILTLFVVPAIYSLLTDLRAFFIKPKVEVK